MQLISHASLTRTYWLSCFQRWKKSCEVISVGWKNLLMVTGSLRVRFCRTPPYLKNMFMWCLIVVFHEYILTIQRIKIKVALILKMDGCKTKAISVDYNWHQRQRSIWSSLLLERCSDIFLSCISFDNVSAFPASPSDAVLTEAKSKAANYCYFRASKIVLNLDHAISFPLILYGKWLQGWHRALLKTPLGLGILRNK